MKHSNRPARRLPVRRSPPIPGFAAVLAALAAAAAAGPSGAQAQTPTSDTLTLRRAAELGLATHPSVTGAGAALRGARASVSEARAAWYPRFSAGGDLTRFQEPMPVAPIHGLDLENRPTFDRTLVQGRVAMDYTLFEGGARSGRIRGAEARARGARASLREREMDLIHEVVATYLGIVTADEVLAAHAQRVEALDEELARARRFFQEGAAPRVDVLRAEAAATRARADLGTAQLEAELARRDLARLTGLEAAGMEVLRLVPVRAPAAAPPDRDQEEPPPPHPALERARQAVRSAQEGVAVARSSWLPDLTAGAAFSEFGSGGGDFTGEWQASLRVSYPLFTGGARGAAGERARAGLDEAREGLRLTGLELARREDRARSDLEDARGRTRSLAAAERQLEEVARIEALALTAGAGVQRDLLAAQASLLESRAQLAEARSGAVVALAALARARGVLTLEWLERELEAAP